MKHLKRFRDTPKHRYDSPQELTGRVALTRVQNVRGLLGHGTGKGGVSTTALQGVHREVRVPEEGGQEESDNVHRGGV
jgi:hypothetical protein